MSKSVEKIVKKTDYLSKTFFYSTNILAGILKGYVEYTISTLFKVGKFPNTKRRRFDMTKTSKEESRNVQRLNFEDIRMDIQTRVKLSDTVVKQYAKLMKGDEKKEVAPVQFPLMVVYKDANGSYYLADGYHRIEAMKLNGVKEADFEVKLGSKKDAIIYNITANVSHGLRMTNKDKKNAVLRLLSLEGSEKLSAREIAKICGVDHKTVTKYRHEKDDIEAGEGKESDSKENNKKEKVDYKLLYEEAKITIERLTTLNTIQEKTIHELKSKVKESRIDGKLNRTHLLKLIHPDKYQSVLLPKNKDLYDDLNKACQIINGQI